MFDIGIQELIVIFLVALLVFGPEKLPEVGRTLGSWMLEIRKGIASAKIQMDTEFDAKDRKADSTISSYVPDELKTHADQSDAKMPEDVKSKENT